MEFSKDEKDVLRGLIIKQLKEIEQNESLPDQPIAVLSTEIKYDEFLTMLLNKLK